MEAEIKTIEEDILPKIRVEIETLTENLQAIQNDRQAIRDDSEAFKTKLKPRIEKKKARKSTFENCLQNHADKFEGRENFEEQISKFENELKAAQIELKSIQDAIEAEKAKLAKFEVEESKLKDVKVRVIKYVVTLKVS